MSTYQPPGGPPQGSPGYVPPQDPWAGLEHGGGLASMPTDPIPQQYEQPSPTGGEVWSQATVQHGGPLGPAIAEPQRSRAGLLAIIFLAVLVLGGGGGYAAFYLVKKHGETTTSTNTPLTDRQKAVVGDCMVNAGTEATPNLQIVACSTANSLKVVKVVRGDAVPRDSQGVVNPKTASAAICASLKYDNYYVYWDPDAPAQNVVICLAMN